MPQRVTIIHTNDFHNHLTQTQADLLKAAKNHAGPNTLLVDAGDAISAGNVGVRPYGEPILTLMSDAGYNAMTMGNREFHIADSILRHKIGNAQFPILSANIRYKNESSDPLPAQPFIEKLLPNGVRIGVIGVTVPMVTERMAARHISSFLFDDPIVAVRKFASELRPKVDILIALTHIGIKADEELAKTCPELNLIITGHTHLVIRHGEKVEGVPIVQAGWFGHYYGIVELEIDPPNRPRIISSDILALGEPS